MRDTLGVPESASVEDEPAEGSEGAEPVDDEAGGDGGDEDATAKATRDVEEAMSKMPKPGAGGEDDGDAHDGDEL